MGLVYPSLLLIWLWETFYFALQRRHNERDGVLNHVYSTVYSGADQRKLHAPGVCHRSPVNSPHKGQVTRKMSPFDDVIILRVRRVSVKDKSVKNKSKKKISDSFLSISVDSNFRVSK